MVLPARRLFLWGANNFPGDLGVTVMNLSLSVCLKWIEDSFDWYNRSIDRALRQRDLVKAQNALAAREACERIATEFRDNFARHARLASMERNGRPGFRERTKKGWRSASPK